MSQNLVTFVQDFLMDSYDCSEFCNQHSHRWKIERDSGELSQDEARTSEVLSSIFCLVDLFNPADNREEYELDDRCDRVDQPGGDGCRLG